MSQLLSFFNRTFFLKSNRYIKQPLPSGVPHVVLVPVYDLVFFRNIREAVGDFHAWVEKITEMLYFTCLRVGNL